MLKNKSKAAADEEKKNKSSNNNEKCNSGIFKTLAWCLFSKCLKIIHIIKDKLLELILGWYLGDRQLLPKIPIENIFLTKSAVELAKMIRMKKITSHQLVKAYIDRINQINPIINAIIDGPFQEEALIQAKLIDERISNDQISADEYSEKPFLGVPFTTKDSTSVKNKLHTLGLISRITVKSTEDAECIRLMKSAGAIIIATTNVPEINGWQETRNNIIGQTNNPYDTRRTVGGSSGGEAALITACGTAFGIGTDIGGSIRMPSFFCGIFGHKPTVGLINTKGCTLRTGEEKSTMIVAGPMTRYAIDLLESFKILVGPQNRIMLKLDESVNIKKLKYYYIRQSNELRCSPVSKEMQTAMTKVVQHFKNISEFPVEKINIYGINYTSKLWRYWRTQETDNFNLLIGKKLNAWTELCKKLIGQSDYTLALIYSLFDGLLPKENASKMKEITTKCYQEITDILNDNGIIFYHNTTYTAPFHYMPFINIYNFSYWCIFNVLQIPATQVPLGLDSKGLPLGIQVISAKYRDRDCLAVAAEIESAFNGWVKPFEINYK